MSAETTRFRFFDYFWPLGVGMLTGWVCLYLFLVYVLTHGSKIQGWHGVVWVAATFVGTWIVVRGQRTEDGGRSTESSRSSAYGIRHLSSGLWHQIQISGALTCLALILPLAFSWILGHFTDFSWDGMTSRGITVRNLMKGDPALNAYPFGHVLAGFLAHLTGSWQGGKGINLTMIWICFCFVFSALQSLNFSGWKLWFLSIVTALNPVAVYQISCFQIDGHVASLITCLLFSMLRILVMGPIALDGVLALVAAFAGSAASKTSGVFYAIIIDGIFLLFLAGVTRRWKKVMLLMSVAVMVSWPLGIMIRSLGQFEPLDLQRLRASTKIETPSFGVGGGASNIQALKKLDRIQQFVASSCSYTENMPEQIRLKPPFWIQRRELRAVEDLFPDPRSGGFGPLFSAGLLVSGIGCLFLVLGRRVTYWPGWFLFLATAVSSFGSQVWWARWTPQNWLLLMALLMTVLAPGFQGSPQKDVQGVRDSIIRGLALLACLVTGANILLVTVYYFVGMVKHEIILNRQLALASKLILPVPLYVPVIPEGQHMAGSALLASRHWFADRGIPISELQQEPPRPRMKVHRTDARFPLPPDWRFGLRDPEDEKLFRNRGLIED